MADGVDTDAARAPAGYWDAVFGGACLMAVLLTPIVQVAGIGVILLFDPVSAWETAFLHVIPPVVVTVGPGYVGHRRYGPGVAVAAATGVCLASAYVTTVTAPVYTLCCGG